MNRSYKKNQGGQQMKWTDKINTLMTRIGFSRFKEGKTQ